MINIDNKINKIINKDTKTNKIIKGNKHNTIPVNTKSNSPYELLDKNYFSKISDQQLLKMANNIISPDASLDKFQLKYKNDRYKEEIVRVYDDDIKQNFKFQKSIDNLKKSKEIGNNCLNTESSFQSKNKIPQNIKNALEYYNILNS